MTTTQLPNHRTSIEPYVLSKIETSCTDTKLRSIIQTRARFSIELNGVDGTVDFVIMFRLINGNPVRYKFPIEAEYFSKQSIAHKDLEDNINAAVAWLHLAADNYAREFNKAFDSHAGSRVFNSVNSFVNFYGVGTDGK